MIVHTFFFRDGYAIGLVYAKSDWKAVPNQTAQPSFFVTATCDGHHNNISIQRKKEKEDMAKTYKIPVFVRLGNILTLTLLRAGFPLVGPFLFFGSYPMYLLTVCGRKSGLPRTVALAIIERDGKRYVGSPYGIVDWVRNLRAAGEAVLTRRRRTETVMARELSKGEAALVLQEEIKGGNPFGHYYGVTADSSLEEFERAVIAHPLFLLERK
ncbi:MAG TPA: nitroreductase family deazaflavin-dependent oxidoreductase [Ktedonobacteraceae bacterium]|nr:nitroreductase family deazaflavin-dependent oxidoreductase [Ktedonobacteraceae bacterium]